MRRIAAVWVLALGCAGGVSGAEDEGTPDLRGAADAVAPSLVVVEYTLQVDRGDVPSSNAYEDPEDELIRQERPLERPGLLLSDSEVITPDIQIHPRFIRAVHVRAGEARIPARVSATARRHSATYLSLESPLPGARPLAFADGTESPAVLVQSVRVDGTWCIRTESWKTSPFRGEDGERYEAMAGMGVPGNRGFFLLGLDASGRGVSVWTHPWLPEAEARTGNPLAWDRIPAEEYERLCGRVRESVDRVLPRVRLGFRSPKEAAGDEMSRFSSGVMDMDGGDGESTERDVVGVVLRPDRVLVLSELRPNVTARLERIHLFLPGRTDPVPARFLGTLRDYGAFLAAPDAPLEGAPSLCDDPAASLTTRLLPSATVLQQGEGRTVHCAHHRISGWEPSWHGQLAPQTALDTTSAFLFDEASRLVALPLRYRTRSGDEENRRWRRRADTLLLARYLSGMLEDSAPHLDPNNTPLSEQEENRLAWLGVEMQPLGRELARLNGVSHLTRDGETGALVSYVYPGSPAAEAGIAPGAILLRIHVDGEPRPMEIQLEDRGSMFGEGFPWEQLDQIPEEYFEQLPPPWPSAENALTRALTDFGPGRRYVADFFSGGEPFSKPFEIVLGPSHYNSAPEHHSEAIGLTVRDMTFEVRRYFQRSPEDPGVIVSRIEPGGRASVSGVRPYEIVTHINDREIRSVADFERVLGEGKELRLSILRMARPRVVKIRMDAPPPPSDDPPAEPDPDEEAPQER